jgi:hypothetical protein
LADEQRVTIDKRCFGDKAASGDVQVTPR